MKRDYDYYYSSHHIRSIEEIYNELADHIVSEYLRAHPNDNTNHMTVESMISRLSNDSIRKTQLEDQVAKNVNESIAHNFATINSLFHALDTGTIELHPQAGDVESLDTD